MDMADVSNIEFDRALKFSLTERGTPDLKLKTQQLEALRAVVQQKRDVLAVLPTGYGKSLIYQLLPSMFNFLLYGGKYCSIAIIVSPLTALMMDQVEKIKKQGQSAAIIQAKCSEANKETGIEVQGDSVENVLCGRVSIVFAHPEVLCSSKKCREMLLSDVYQKNVVCVVADEAHCIVDWGYDFRPDYGKLDTLASIFPSKSFIALTATAPVAYQNVIIEHFAMQNPLRVLENPNRSNIFYEIIQRPAAVKENNEDQFEKLINKLGLELKELRIKFPLTILYTSLHLCGFGYNLLEQQLGDFQYFPPGCVHTRIPSNRLFAQFHSPQSKNMKEEIIKDVTSENPIQRLLLVTIAFGMGIDPPNVQRVIHFGVPRKMEHYLQETGRAGRNGQFATATMYFNSNDIATNVEGMDDSMRILCRNQDEECRRKLILNYFNFSVEQSGQPLHLCCDICKKRCKCDVCLLSDSLAVIACGDGSTPVDECEQVVPSFSARQKEEIRKQLEDYKNTLGKASRFGLGPATSFNDKLIEMVCKKPEILLSREAVQQYLPVWREEHVDNIFRIVQSARESHL